MEHAIQILDHWFDSLPAVLQLIVLLILIAAIIVLVVRKLRNADRLRRMQDELDHAKRESLKLNGQLIEIEKNNDELAANNGELQSEVGSLKESAKQITAKHRKVSTGYRILKADWERLEKQFKKLEEVDSTVWFREIDSNSSIPQFVPREERKTRFVAVQNLKGGVGKTTTVANLGSAFATGVIDKKNLNVLIVDLDFQGSLSNICVDHESLAHRSGNEFTSGCLIEDKESESSVLINRLMTGIQGTGVHGKAIIADETLERSDFRQQSRFFINKHEVRFCHRFFFHDQFIFDNFDLVFFDCPPRLTTSSFNAVLASDYVLIPTTLHPNDVDSIERTVHRLDDLFKIASFRADVGGVGIVINKSFYGEGTTNKLTKAEARQLLRLKESVHQYEIARDTVFENSISNSSLIPKYAEGSTPLGSHADGRKIYGRVAKELYDSIAQYTFKGV